MIIKIKALFMWPVFHLILKPLIKRNYRLREESSIKGDGKYPDQWYWADKLAISYGYAVSGKTKPYKVVEGRQPCH